ncbi:MAG: AMP-dependent synthetase [Proteobacteria bacterium]|nr:AMP-dependent synthetase [Pseudomonadota bacterium]
MTQSEDIILLPEVLSLRREGESLALDLRVPERLAYLPGHFPGTPIVPGVVQIQWAVHFAREYLGLELPFGHMEVVKFKDLLLPGQQLTLLLRYQAESGKVKFSFRAGDREFSSGRLYFRKDDV